MHPRPLDERYLRPIDNWQPNSMLPAYGWSDRSPHVSSFNHHYVLAQVKRFFSKKWQASTARTPLATRPPLTPLSQASASPVKFVVMCCLWYTTSALSSNTGKAIMTQFRYPVTLTIVQFGFVAAYCLLFMTPAIRFTRLRYPTKAIVRSTLPMGMFQVGGHVFSSIAISRIPVSTVHTIKVRSSRLVGVDI
jgi:solute carrier family 35, member E1